MTRTLPLALFLLASPAVAGDHFPDAGKMAPCPAAIHYAPEDNLEAIDVSVIDSAREKIDMATYVLTSIPVIEALTRAADRGVTVRLYRDGGARRAPKRLREAFDALFSRPSVAVKYKKSPAPFMHLKAYAVDGRVLREGAGNFTHSGLIRQDNSLVILACEAAAKAFETKFESMWRRK
jgi:phosphatidylserine/phosphatidylglycerophosphate/cardiolipin synthase-like enzyme